MGLMTSSAAPESEILRTTQLILPLPLNTMVPGFRTRCRPTRRLSVAAKLVGRSVGRFIVYTLMQMLYRIPNWYSERSVSTLNRFD